VFAFWAGSKKRPFSRQPVNAAFSPATSTRQKTLEVAAP
jgi:hypothetical protein